MGIIDHISRYFLAPPDLIFEEQRIFYRDLLRGEELHDNLRRIDETEMEYICFVKYLPNILDCLSTGVSLFTGNLSYLALLVIPEGLRMAEMRSGFIYDYYSRKLAESRQTLFEKDRVEVGNAIDDVFKEYPFEAQKLKLFGVDCVEEHPEEIKEEPATEEITLEELIGDDGSVEELPEGDYDDDCEKDGESSMPWDRKDGDGWKKGSYKND